MRENKIYVGQTLLSKLETQDALHLICFQAAGINTVTSAVETKRGLRLGVSGKASREGVIEASFEESMRFSKVETNTVAKCREWKHDQR